MDLRNEIEKIIGINIQKRAIDSDENFASSFDDSKSVDDAYKILVSFKTNK